MVTNFLDAINLLLQHSQYCNLIVFSFDNRSFYLSTLRQLWSCLVTALYILLNIFSVYNVALKKSSSFFKSAHIIISLFNMVNICGAWISGILRKKDFIALLNGVIDYDIKSNLKINYQQFNQQIKKRLTIRYAILIPITTFSFIGYYWLNAVLSNLEVIGKIIEIYVNSAISFQCSEIILIIKTRLAFLNKDLKTLAATPSKLTAAKKLNQIAFLHHHSSKLINSFNITFGLTLLLMFAMSFLNIVVSLFFVSIEVQSTAPNLFKIAYTIVSTGFMFDSFYICNVCYSTIEEVICTRISKYAS